jgi:hypothetical protein
MDKARRRRHEEATKKVMKKARGRQLPATVL